MSDPTNDAGIHRADPEYRRRMRLWLLVTSVVGAGLLLAFHLWLQQLTRRYAGGDPETLHLWLSRLLAALCLMLATSAAAFASWIWRLAAASKRDRRWPPVGMRTSSDLRIRYLTSADALVAQMRAGAASLVVLALALAAWALWLIHNA